MKKKIINGILMVALVGATSTSFVSCKDTSEDVKTDLMAQVNAVKAELTPRIEKAESDISTLQGRMTTAEGDISNLQGRMTTAEGNITTLQGDVAGLKTRVDNLEKEKDSLAQVTKTIENQLANVESQINTIVKALENLVTSVNVNATSTSLLTNSKLFPGINAQFLGAAYGVASYAGQFPSTEADDYIANHGVVLTANEIKAVDGAIEWNANDYLPVEKANAGTVYFTLNPSNIDALDAEQLGLSLVNSQNAESYVKLGTVEQDTETVLEWGYTRAAADYQPKLWKATATIDLDDAEAKEKIIDPTQVIDFKNIGENFKTLIRDSYRAAKKGDVATGVLKAGSQIVVTLLQSEIPAMPALALKAEWNDTVGTRSVLSDYSIAATAYKPLSFGFGAELGIDGRTISLDKIDAAVAKVINKIQDKANQFDLKLQDVKIELNATSTSKVYLVVDPTATDVEISISNEVPTGATEWTAGSSVPTVKYYTVYDLGAAVPGDALAELVTEGLNVIADVNGYAERAKNFEVRVTNYLEDFINKVILKIADDGLTRVLEPVMLYEGNEGVWRLARLTKAATIKAGTELNLIPTTLTYELFAPAYKKYIAVIGKDGKAREAVIKTNGEKNFNKWSVTIEEGDQAIVYSALDFSGKQIAKRYNIQVVK